ncbi:NCS2 family permease [Actinomadura yumaensis]|uniref:NCS2 family permease n=1 Tax=Actinomadura yumaensis TaxID=111807 RepID=UPI00361A82A6
MARELRGGVTTFFAMAYIILLNPIILGGAKDVTGAQLSIPQLTTMTALSAAVTTVIMGLVGNAPLALAAGLGINAVVAFQAAPEMTWPQAMGLVVIEGAIIVLLALTGVRERIMNAIPLALKHAIAVGIGAFIALVGLVDSGFVTSNAASPPLALGTGGHLETWPTVVFAFALLLMIVLYVRKVQGAILIGIVAATVLAVVIQANASVKDGGWGVVTPDMPDKLFASPDFGLLGEVDLFGGFGRAGVVTALVVLFTLVLSGFFDAMGTILGVSDEAGLVDERGQVPRLGRVLSVDGVSAALGGVTSSSANTVFVESAAGVGGGPHGPGQPGDRGAVRGDAVPDAARAGGARAGRRARPGRGRRADDGAGRQARLGRHRDHDPGVPHHRVHAVHLLDHERHRRGRGLLYARPGGARAVAPDALAAVGDLGRLRGLFRAERRGEDLRNQIAWNNASTLRHPPSRGVFETLTADPGVN